MALPAVVLAGGMEGQDGAGDGSTSQGEKTQEKGSFLPWQKHLMWVN